MARLTTYLNDNSISGEDRLVGSNYIGVNNYQTNNFKIKDLTEYIQGQISISPSNSTLKTNGGIVNEVINGTNSLAIDLSATSITGQLANSDLVNSSITINGTAVSLGGTITIGEVTEVTAGTYLNGGGTEGTVTVNHDTTSRADTTSVATPGYAASFTVIDTLTTNATGHVTAANVKTVTIPASDNTNTTYTVEAVDDGDDAKIQLVGLNPSSTDDIKLKAGSNITINVNETTDEIEIVGTAFGNTFTVANETAHLALTTSSGDLVIRTDQSKTYIDNGTNASPNVMSNYTELQFSGIQQIDLVAGDGIDLEDHASNAITTLTQNNNDLKVINTLATASERGGIKIGYTESGKNYPVELDSEKAFVNVPWVNTNQLTEWVLTDDDDDNTTINHGKHVKFVMATGALGTNTTGAGTDADPYLVTLTSPDNNTTYSAGGGLDLNGTVFSHTDTSSQASVDNSGRTYIQDITLDTYGHVTGLVSATETVTNTNQLTTWDLLDDDDDSFTIAHDKHVKFTSSTGAYGTEITGAGTSSDPYIVAITSPNDTVANTFRTIKVDTDGDGTADNTLTATEDLMLKKGSNITLTEADGVVTISSTDNNTTNWNFKVDSGTAENIAATETVTFTGGDRITLAQNGKTIDIAGDILTLTDLNTVTSAMTGDDTLTFGDTDEDTSIVIRGNLQVTGTTTTNNVETVSTSNGVVFEGTTADANELTLKAGALNADRTVTIPDATFTIPTQDTWNANTKTVAGYVAAPGAVANKVWKTDANGNPAWRDDADEQLSDAEVITAIVNSTGITPVNKTTIRSNIGAGTSSFDGDYDNLTNKPTIPSGNQIIDWSVSQSGSTPAVIHAENYTNTEYSEATSSAAGLMSTDHHDKLDGIADNANNYSLPAATASARGGIKVGTNLSITNDVLSADSQTANDFTNALKTKLDNIADNANNYSLPIATDAALGGIKIGDGLSINSTTGVVSGLELGTTGSTALAGNTALFSGDYDDLSNKPTTISSTQAANILTNNSKVSDTGVPAIKSDGNSPSLNTNITAAEIRTLIGAGTGNGTLTAEADTLATVTGRGASTSTDTTFNSNLTVSSSDHFLYVTPNSGQSYSSSNPHNPGHAHGFAFGWNRSGGSRHSNIIFAAGSDANATQEANASIKFEYKAVNGTISTAAKLWSGGNFNTAGYITVQNGGNTITNTRVGQWNTAYGWGNHASAGYSTFSGSYNDLTNKPTIPSNYLRDNADDTSSGSLTVVSYKFNGNASNPTNTTATIYDQANQGPTISGLGVCFRTGSTPSQTGKLNSSGTFTVSGDIIAYGSPSDISLKENIKPIENALDKVEKLQGVTFDWKEKQEDILNIKEDIGFIAQDVQKVLPELVRKNENGKLSLRHQGVIPVLLEAIKELSDRIKVLENGSTN